MACSSTDSRTMFYHATGNDFGTIIDTKDLTDKFMNSQKYSIESLSKQTLSDFRPVSAFENLLKYNNCNGKRNGLYTTKTDAFLNKHWKSVGMLYERNQGCEYVSTAKSQVTKLRGKNGIRSCERECNGISGSKLGRDISDENKLLKNDKHVIDHKLASTKERSLEDSSSCESREDNEAENNNQSSDPQVRPKASANSSLDSDQFEDSTHSIDVCDSQVRSVNALLVTKEEPISPKSDDDTQIKLTENDESQVMNDDLLNSFSSSEDLSQQNRTNLIVNYLPQNMTQDEIRRLFETIGEVDSCKLVRDRNTSQNLGYGFVNYIHAKDAEKAIATLNGFQLQNKIIKVSLARPSSESIKGANLYISGLPNTMTQQELEELFAPCGKIITSRILYDNNTGLSRGVGFIRFDQRSEAEEAIKKLNGTIPENATEPITVKLANSPASTPFAVSSTLNEPRQYWNTSNYVSEKAAAVHSSHPMSTSQLTAKPNQAALTMFLLQQMQRYPRLNHPGAWPFQNMTPRSSKPSVSRSNTRGFHAPLLNTTTPQKIPPGLLFSQQACTSNKYPFRNRSQFVNMSPFSSKTSGNLVGPHACTPETYPSHSPHIVQPMFYQRCKFPANVTSVLGAPANLPGNGFAQPPPFMPHPFSFQTFPFPEQNALATTIPYNGSPFSSFFQPGILGCSSSSISYPDLSSSISSSNAPVTFNGFGNFPFPNNNFPTFHKQSLPSLENSMNQPSFSLLVCNLPPDIEEATLWRLFGPFGAVRSVRVVRDTGTNSCQGIGFVNMTSYMDAVFAVQHLNGYPIGNRHLQVSLKPATAGDILGVASTF